MKELMKDLIKELLMLQDSINLNDSIKYSDVPQRTADMLERLRAGGVPEPDYYDGETKDFPMYGKEKLLEYGAAQRLKAIEEYQAKIDALRNALEDCLDDSRGELQRLIDSGYGDEFRPYRVDTQKETISKAESAMKQSETGRDKL